MLFSEIHKPGTCDKWVTQGGEQRSPRLRRQQRYVFRWHSARRHLIAAVASAGLCVIVDRVIDMAVRLLDRLL